MEALTDDDIYPVGKYNDSKTKMADVPTHYLIWVHDNEKCPIEVSNYVMENWDVLQKELKEGK